MLVDHLTWLPFSPRPVEQEVGQEVAGGRQEGHIHQDKSTGVLVWNPEEKAAGRVDLAVGLVVVRYQRRQPGHDEDPASTALRVDLLEDHVL